MPRPTSSAPPTKSGVLEGLCARYVALAARRTGWLLIACALPVALALVFVLGLELRSDMAELLPPDDPVVLALKRTQPVQKGSTNLVVIFESHSAAANAQIADALRPELDKLVPDLFTEIEWRPDRELPEFAEHNKWLYADRADLERADELLDKWIALRENPLMVDLDDESPEQALDKLRGNVDSKAPPVPREDAFVGELEGWQLRGVMLWRRGPGLSLGAEETVAAVKAAIARVDPKRYAPDVRVLYTGAIGRGIDEHDAVRDDLTLASLICTSAVLLVLWLYFRRAAMLWVIGAPAFAGVILALGLAQRTAHALNLNTSFLVPIILGNGINAPIVLLARYGEERRAGADVRTALERALRGTMVGTATGMGAASIAYASLGLTSFRGFNQFGLIGGSGMLFVWLWTFLLVPPMTIFLERLRPGLLTPPATPLRAPFALLGRLVERRPRALALLTLAALGCTVPPILRWSRSPLEWDMHKLASSDERWAGAWRRMHMLGMGSVGAGYIGTDGVLLVDRPEQAEPVASALMAQDRAFGKGHVLKQVRTIKTVLPAEQDAKLEILARLRRKIDRLRPMLSAEQLADALRFRPPDDLHALAIDELPRRARENFTEVDGRRGRLIGIDADTTNFSDWNGHDLLRLERSMRVSALGQTWVAAATSTVFASMLESMLRDGPKVIGAALAGVLLIILFAFGRGAAMVIGPLAVGVAWQLGLLAVLDVHLNFANFVGLCITLGVGVDYAANVWARLRTDERTAQAIAETGSAVALCSVTTIIGYSTLLLASNRALRSFGVVADLGEITCLTAALVLLPAIAVLLRRRRG